MLVSNYWVIILHLNAPSLSCYIIVANDFILLNYWMVLKHSMYWVKSYTFEHQNQITASIYNPYPNLLSTLVNPPLHSFTSITHSLFLIPNSITDSIPLSIPSLNPRQLILFIILHDQILRYWSIFNFQSPNPRILRLANPSTYHFQIPNRAQ